MLELGKVGPLAWFSMHGVDIVRVQATALRVTVELDVGTLLLEPPGQRCYLPLPGLSLSYAGRELPAGLAVRLQTVAQQLAEVTWAQLLAIVQEKPRDFAQRLRDVPCVDLGVVCDPLPLLSELNQVLTEHAGALWVAEPQRDSAGRGWASVALRNRGGLDGADTSHDEAAPNLAWAWTPVGQACPRLRALLESLVDLPACTAIHAMRLAPRGHIAPHSDAPHTQDQVGEVFNGSLNLALSQPLGCTMRIGLDPGGTEGPATVTVPFTLGRAFLLDVGRWHRIDNDSDQERVHLVVRSGPSAWPKLADLPSQNQP